ncbi:MAG: hypothetical protein K2L08_01850, partial [Erysipelotrichaceae bacterium]|nr:hypothetical protein [Erysipelotrichaceae bacterium]
LKEEENLYKWMGQDGFLGTSDDKYVTSETNNWPENITDFLADEIRIKTEAGETEDIQIKIGTQTKFIAEIYFRDQLMDDYEVTWSINGQGDPNTTISEDGVLSVGANERGNTQINIIATSKQAPNKLRSSITVTVTQLGYNDIPSIVPGSSITITMGNYEYYVLAKDNEKALVSVKNYFMKNSHIGTSGITVPWRDWTLRSYLNGDWLNAQPDEVKNNVIETTLYTRDETYGIIETQDKVFLLNYEDFSEGNDPRLYTAGKPFSLDNFPDISSNLRGVTSRMPNHGSGSFANTKAILNGREITEEFLSHEKKIAPVFWIRLP